MVAARRQSTEQVPGVVGAGGVVIVVVVVVVVVVVGVVVVVVAGYLVVVGWVDGQPANSVVVLILKFIQQNSNQTTIFHGLLVNLFFTCQRRT